MWDGFQRCETEIGGCLRINPRVQRDDRGSFVKIRHPQAGPLPEDEFTSVEEFYSRSRKRVLRGLHFQRPPAESAKLVHCLWGRILDVVVDLRVGSPTYGQHAAFDLCGERADMLLVPVGLAHGFYVLSEEAVVLYKSTRAYSPAHDTGIHWASAGIAWPDPDPVLSDRDRQFPSLDRFRSPFRYETPGRVLFARYRVRSSREDLTESVATKGTVPFLLAQESGQFPESRLASEIEAPKMEVH